jgi:hypothetical protein
MDDANDDKRFEPDKVSQTPDYPEPSVLAAPDVFIWSEDKAAIDNYVAFGQRLAAVGDLYRRPQYAGGLLLAIPGLPPIPILKGSTLAPVIADRVRIQVVKDGKPRGSRIPSAHLETMLSSEVFLQRLRVIDTVTSVPIYRADFTLAPPNYSDGGRGQRFFYLGASTTVVRSTKILSAFLNAMAFATPADRTNALAAAITVALHNLWPGAKPVISVTADKSHSGKDTIVAFAAGSHRLTSVSYQRADWALQRDFVGALKLNPETVVMNIENARLDHGAKIIASAFLERFIGDPEPVLFSTGSGSPTHRRNDLIVAITTNYGSLSADLMNRSLPIHLAATGNIEERSNAIGNPKLQFLPMNRPQIEAEIRGMIEIWKDAGCPLNPDAKHPFIDWARMIGGILAVNGFTDFLGNVGARKSGDDPIRRCLGLLGAWRPNVWLPPAEWAGLVAELGLVKILIPESDRDSEAGRVRGIGVVLSAHRDETFVAETDDERCTLRLDRARRRFKDGEISTRYKFEPLNRMVFPCDDGEQHGNCSMRPSRAKLCSGDMCDGPIIDR